MRGIAACVKVRPERLALTSRKAHRYPYRNNNRVRRGFEVVKALQVDQSESATHRHERLGGNAGYREIARFVKRGRDVVVETGTSGYPSANLLAAALAGVRSDQPDVQSLLILPEPDDVQSVASLSTESLGDQAPGDIRIVHLGQADDARMEEKAVSAAPDVVVTTPQRLIDHIRRDNVALSRVAVCVLCPPTGEAIGQFSADLHYIYTKFDRQPTTILFRQTGSEEMSGIEELIRRPATVVLDDTAPRKSDPSQEPRQEQTAMARKDLPFDAESTAQQLRDIVRRIHEDEDPAEMNQYKRFIKKHVSVFARAYFTAYLFKQLAGGKSLPSAPPSGASGASGAQASIFVSAGRNRRVHARDLVTLFTSADGVSREDVGQIKVLDNYSFVEVATSKAKLAIDALDGSDFRGRKLTVNFARKK
jgi:DbpA-like RNA binding protein